MSQLKEEDRGFVIGMFSPTAFIFFAGVFLPILYGLFLSFFYTDRFKPGKETFVLFGNYSAYLFGNLSSEFYRVYFNTIMFTIVTVTFELILGLAFALIINKSFKGRGFVRAAILVPWAMPTIVNASLWKYMFKADVGGLANDIFVRLGLLDHPINYTTEGDRVLINFIFLIAIIFFVISLFIVAYGLLSSLYNGTINEYISQRSFYVTLIILIVSSIFAVFLPMFLGLDTVYGYSTDSLLNLQAPVLNWPTTIKLPTTWIIIFIIDIWKTTPFMALLILASLQVIPQDLYKAASVDGATSFQQFKDITLPLIMPGIGVALIFRCIDAFRIYDILAVFGLEIIDSITVLAFQNAKFGNYGQAASVAMITFLNIMAFTIAFFYLTRRRDDE